jgi:long-chain acyl-CoA synthetase
MLRFSHDLGIRVKEGYGITESTGLSFIHMDDDIRRGTVGKPIPGIEFKLAKDGGLLKRGSIFVGYSKNHEATANTFIDGWLHTAAT